MATRITKRSNVNTLLKRLREERVRFKTAGRTDVVRKIDFIGKQINHLINMETSS